MRATKTKPSPEKKPLPFEIRRSPIQGRGAFATRPIPRGERVIEYTGARIDDDEADRRYADDGMQRHHTFLFAIEGGLAIDGADGGNEARFINHSCAPNCESIEEEGRIFIEALRRIEPGEELVYDYAYARTAATTKEDEVFYTCRCGAPTCRGTILAPKKAPKKASRRAPKKASGRAPKKASKKAETPRTGAKGASSPRAPGRRKVAAARRR